MNKTKKEQNTDRVTEKRITPLKDLNLTDRFLFDEVMEDLQTLQDVLSIILDNEMLLLIRSETEKEIRVSPMIRSIRMDVYAEDEAGNVYNTEMQNMQKTDLARRSRYYQAMIDSSLLQPGIPDYNVLKDSFLIMIMTFDMFGHGLYRYTFLPQCMEIPGLYLPDGTTRMFLNTKGHNDKEVSPELIQFLKYVEHSTEEMAGTINSERIHRIHERVCKVKASEKVGVKYMQAWEERYFARMEAIAEGRAEGRAEGQNMLLKSLIKKKLAKGKTIEVIAEELEEEEAVILDMINSIKAETE